MNAQRQRVLTRRSGGVLLLLAFTLALIVTSCRAPGEISSGEVSTEVSDGPNIVLISTDDQALIDLNWMPRTRRLIGDQGATFTDFIAPHPLCCPSRAQLLTGQYAQNNGVRGNRGIHGGYPSLEDPDHTLPVWLSDVGYRTSFVGKYINGYDPATGVPAGWDEWDATVRFAYRGYQQYDGELLTQPDNYHTDYVADRTTDEIERLAADDRPFFLWSSYYAPHGLCSASNELGCSTPPDVAPRFAKDYTGVRGPFLDSPSFNESDVSDKPRYVTRGGRVEPAKAQRLFTKRLQSLASVDLAVARIVETLRRTGELDNTVIAFTSDNGYLFGEHGYVGKTLAYEESLRVPLLMRGPGITPGAVPGRTAAMIDLAPTFAEMADAQPLVPVDGESLVGPAGGAESDQERTLLVQAGMRGPDRRGLGWDYRGVRTERYTLIYWVRTGFVELYDRRRDPYQIDNVAQDPRYSEVLLELADRTRTLGDCSGDSCRTDFGPLPAPLR
jgi:N-acetylglucosamine-6-sulfatase